MIEKEQLEQLRNDRIKFLEGFINGMNEAKRLIEMGGAADHFAIEKSRMYEEYIRLKSENASSDQG